MTDDRDDAPGTARALLSRLKDRAGRSIPTSSLGRLSRTAGVAVKGGVGALAGKLKGAGDGLGALDAATVEQMVLSLGELKGIAMKVGQMWSYIDDSMPEETRRLLALLQVHSQPMDTGEIEGVLRTELGARAADLLATLEREPVATASIGQVHRATLPDGTPVAVKVRHTGALEAIRADLKGARVGKVFAHLMAPGVDIGEMVAEAEARFLEECDYANEAKNQLRFRELYEGDPRLVIPAVHLEWSSARVLTTTWCEGMGLDAFLARGPDAETRQRVARALYDFYVGSLYAHGLFNADPHPGNLLLEDDGRLVVLDHGCVRVFDQPTVEALKALSRAVRDDDVDAMRRALVELGVKDPGPRDRFEPTRTLLRGFFGPVLEPGVHAIRAGVDLRMQEVIKSKRQILRLRLPGKLLFLFRIRFGLYAVLARLGAELDWRALESELADG